MVGSALAGMSWSAGSLILFRVLQGLGGGMLMPLGMTILTKAAGPDRVGRVMAVLGVPMLLGPIVGPILGGWLVEDYSWRWIFFINIPIGIAALVTSFRILPRDVAAHEHRLDWKGLFMLSPGLALLIYGLARTNAAGGFGHAEVLVPVLVGLAMIGMFVLHSLRTPDALIDVRLFANRVFAASSVTLVLAIIAMFGGMLLLPLYLQVVRGESPMTTGLLIAPQGFGAMIAMPIAGRLTDKTGAGRIVPVGLTLVGLAFLGLTQLGAHTSYVAFGLLLFVMGLGMGSSMMPTFSAAMQTLRESQIAKASTTLNINQQTGASIGTAVMSVLLAHQLASHLGGAGGSHGGIGVALPPGVREHLAPAMAAAFGSTFWWAVAFVAVALVVAIVLLPKNKPEPLEPAEGDEGDEGEAADATAPPVLVH
jgi:EmrB/QacA subfamily drug resistance transporter